jgi:CHAT domain-containing protein
MSFAPLEDTKGEGESIARMLSAKSISTVTLTDSKATKAEILGADDANLVHIATHGFYLPDKEASSLSAADLGLDSDDSRNMLLEQKSNPMYRSGLALAGANDDQKSGVLYASEIAGLDLSRTRLVVLSACDTGVGDLESGDGVFGLKRAFLTAGAQSVVTTLWPVASAETTELMRSFYQSLTTSASRSKALRESKLQLMKTHSNPYYWGPAATS